MTDIVDHEFLQLLPSETGADECAEFLLGSRVHRFVRVPLIVELGIQPSVPRLAEWRDRAVGDEWPVPPSRASARRE